MAPKGLGEATELFDTRFILRYAYKGLPGWLNSALGKLHKQMIPLDNGSYLKEASREELLNSYGNY